MGYGGERGEGERKRRKRRDWVGVGGGEAAATSSEEGHRESSDLLGKRRVGSRQGLSLSGTGYPGDRPADHNRDDVQEVGKEIAFLSKMSLGSPKFMNANCETLYHKVFRAGKN